MTLLIINGKMVWGISLCKVRHFTQQFASFHRVICVISCGELPEIIIKNVSFVKSVHFDYKIVQKYITCWLPCFFCVIFVES